MKKKIAIGGAVAVCLGLLIGISVGVSSAKKSTPLSGGENIIEVAGNSGSGNQGQNSSGGNGAGENAANNGVNNTNNGNQNGSSGGNSQSMLPVLSANSKLNTGNLTASGSGREGIEGTGKYNYGEALQKSLLFYELQRSGDLPEEVRCNWRGDSCLGDGSDVGVDLTGGWFDAGDHVKFNLPMSYSAAVLGWSVYEDRKAYEESGQLEYALSNIRWANEYFIKCHPEEEVYYYQVGNGGMDHSWWGPAEVVDLATQRPAYKVTKDSPGSAVVGETAASLAVASIVFEKEDPKFSAECLKHAKSLYRFADSTRSDAGYTQADGFYNSWSGYYDELAWAGAWLYLATGEKSYLQNAESCFTQANDDYDWAMCWDDVHIGAALLLARITDNKIYSQAMEKHLDYWAGVSDQHITYSPKGLAWLDNWGSLRYASTTAYMALLYSRWDGCPKAKSDAYFQFAEKQANYILGDAGRSYLIGFGENYPEHPHHRTAQGSYANNMNEPAEHRHVLYGALVGGPDASDNYTDTVSNYNTNEVACDYNAGFTGLMAGLYSVYHGKTLTDFGAVETPGPELYVEGGINVDGQDFLEIKAYVYNMTAWPARVAKDLELRYYVDLTEVYDAGGTAEGIDITGNYMQHGSIAGLKTWDEANHIYYLSIAFQDGDIYPGGQSQYKNEIQVRMRNPGGVWDNSNDPSFVNMTNGGMSAQTGMALYEGGTLVYGTEPAGGDHAGESVTYVSGANQNQNGNNGNQNNTNQNNTNNNGNNNQNNSNNSNNNHQNNSNSNNSNNNNNTGSNSNVGQVGGSKIGVKTATGDTLSLSVDYDNMTTTASSISGNMSIKNEGSSSIPLKDLMIEYYFTKDSDAGLNFACYHAAINGAGGSYTGVSGASGSFVDAKGTDTDTCCKITFSDQAQVDAGGTLTVNFCINHADWSNFNTANDYSVADASHIVVTSGGSILFGTRP